MVILYGGSFNPPTIAHINIAQMLINKYKPKAFIFIPVGNVYNKEGLIDFNHRYHMLLYFTKKFEHVIISSIENETDQYKGTFFTLNYYQKLYPNDDIFYVVGADNLETMHTWIDYQEMIKKYKFIVLNRNNIKVNKILQNNSIIAKYIDHFIILDDFKPINMSSSDYRESHNDQVVMADINQYIYTHNLYNRGGKNEK